MRRILIFSTAYYPHQVGGAEVAIKEITDRLPADQFAFDMITARLTRQASPHERIGGVNVYRIGFGMAIDKVLVPFWGAFKAMMLNARQPYQAFWPVMVSFAGGAAYIVNIIRNITGRALIPVILTLQEGDSQSHIKYRRGGLIGASWHLALARTDHLTVISDYLARQARAYGYKGEITLVPNAVDVERFSRALAPAARRELRAALGFEDGDTIMVTSSRLVKKNAVSDIIEALTFLDTSYKLLILGDGEEYQRLNDLADKLKVRDRVVFTGYVPHAGADEAAAGTTPLARSKPSLPAYLRAADIFVRPSLSEGLGNSFLEAMAAGLPVIATPVGGIPEFLTDGQTGLFCEVGNPRSIAQKVEKLMKDPESREYIIRQAALLVRNRYSWPRITGEIKIVFVQSSVAV
ncbi:MAG: glycosyltransferase family 4 protein [Patescibacteria group bacterium]|nr:glycosyltransferase family 4 protein [Patescibacteria group bacterium]MDE2172852.1 glycosyltransferase family 4 protein [Patescibacteria group bacterium]